MIVVYTDSKPFTTFMLNQKRCKVFHNRDELFPNNHNLPFMLLAFKHNVFHNVLYFRNKLFEILLCLIPL